MIRLAVLAPEVDLRPLVADWRMLVVAKKLLAGLDSELATAKAVAVPELSGLLLP